MSIKPRATVDSGVYQWIKNTVGQDAGFDQVCIVYNMEAPQDASYDTYPLAIFQPVSDVPIYDMSGESLDMDYQVVLYGNKEKGVKYVRDASDAVIESISKSAISLTGYSYTLAMITNGGTVSIIKDDIQIVTEFNLKGN